MFYDFNSQDVIGFQKCTKARLESRDSLVFDRWALAATPETFMAGRPLAFWSALAKAENTSADSLLRGGFLL